MSSLLGLAAYGSDSESEDSDSRGQNVRSNKDPQVSSPRKESTKQLEGASRPKTKEDLSSKKQKVSLPSFNALMNANNATKSTDNFSGRSTKRIKTGKDVNSGDLNAGVLIPPQLQVKGRKNVSTEDTDAWNTKK
mmetsp:Transcript_2917/g.3438  ORF Transcript_2917/g.3438 Transcript_2917/m.3438 type:complete len:135 (-) Transcript_2917:944-1348(-)